MLRILVGYDGSEHSREAVREAARIAGEAHADLRVVRIVEPLIDAANVQAPSREEALARVVNDFRADMDRALADAGLAPDAGEVVSAEHGDDVAESLGRVAREREADMLVVASRRAAGFRGLLLGSVAQHLLRLSPCPVLVVRQRD